jgi:hypothetical protein
MITPQFTLQLDDRRLLLHFAKLPTTLRTNLRDTITTLTNDLLAQVRGVEHSRTGSLRARTRAFLTEGDTFIRGTVRVTGTPAQLEAAGALEYGAHRSFAVRAYQRKGIAVRAYQRHANIAAERFLRGPAEAMRARALKALQGAVDKSVEETNAAP